MLLSENAENRRKVYVSNRKLQGADPAGYEHDQPGTGYRGEVFGNQWKGRLRP